MSRRLTWVFVIGIVISLAAIVASNDQDAIANVLRHDTSSVVIKIALAIFVGGLVLVQFRDRLGRRSKRSCSGPWSCCCWWSATGYRFELRDAGERVLAELVPGYVASHGQNAEIVRGRGGDFALTAHINGASIPMVLDTGASSVVLTQAAAKAAGLPIEVLNYTVNIETANGRTSAAPVTLDRLAVGALIERDVPALVAQQGQIEKQSARHDLPQPAGKLAGARRPLAAARRAVMRSKKD